MKNSEALRSGGLGGDLKYSLLPVSAAAPGITLLGWTAGLFNALY